MIYLETVMSRHDFVCLQETHASAGTLAAWSGIRGSRYFGDHAQHGIGLLVSEQFLNYFDPDPA